MKGSGRVLAVLVFLLLFSVCNAFAGANLITTLTNTGWTTAALSTNSFYIQGNSGTLKSNNITLAQGKTYELRVKGVGVIQSPSYPVVEGIVVHVRNADNTAFEVSGIPIGTDTVYKFVSTKAGNAAYVQIQGFNIGIVTAVSGAVSLTESSIDGLSTMLSFITGVFAIMCFVAGVRLMGNV